MGDRAPEPDQDLPENYWESFRRSAVERWNQRHPAPVPVAERLSSLAEISAWVDKCRQNPQENRWCERVDHHDVIAIARAALHDWTANALPLPHGGQRLVLCDAVLTGADLQGADLRGADLRGAYLQGADLQCADLQGAIGLPIAADAQERLRAVATAALQPNALEMETWHTCETTHFMAGWAIHLAGEPGKIMEKMLGPEVTGLLLLGSEAHRYFYKSNEEARQFLQGVIEND